MNKLSMGSQKNSSAIRVFQNNEFGEVRTALINDEPYFMLADICRILEIGNPSDVIKRLDRDGVDTVEVIDSIARIQKAAFISEPNLYRVIFQSRKPEARKFEKWVMEDVLPTIRRHGAYMSPEVIEKTLTDPDFIIRLATQLKDEQQKRLQAEEELKLQAPKVNFAESVEISKDCILVRSLSTILKQNGMNVGQNRLFETLRGKGFLIKSGNDRNMPTQTSMDRGLFKVREFTMNSPDGEPRLCRTPYITGKGQVYFTNLFLKEVGRNGSVKHNHETTVPGKRSSDRSHNGGDLHLQKPGTKRTPGAAHSERSRSANRPLAGLAR